MPDLRNNPLLMHLPRTHPPRTRRRHMLPRRVVDRAAGKRVVPAELALRIVDREDRQAMEALRAARTPTIAVLETGLARKQEAIIADRAALTPTEAARMAMPIIAAALPMATTEAAQTPTIVAEQPTIANRREADRLR